MPFTPHDAAVHTLTRARSLLGHAPDAPNGVDDDLRRLALVMAVAAIDTYMHRLIVERVYQHAELPGKLAELGLPFRHALEQADANADAARAERHNNRPRVTLKRVLRERLLRETYQSYEDVKQALGMAGLSGNWGQIGESFEPTLTADDIKRRLNGIVARRNRIVHEGDYERLDRPQTARIEPIDPDAALADVAFLEDPVDAIHSVA
jgi:hypothetical protein